LALLRAACPDEKFRDGAEAQKHAQAAFDAGEGPRHIALSVLAAAAAQAGDFNRAVLHQTQSLQEAPPESKPLIRERLELFQRGEPYRRKAGWWRMH
jgi:hypothetical protein